MAGCEGAAAKMMEPIFPAGSELAQSMTWNQPAPATPIPTPPVASRPSPAAPDSVAPDVPPVPGVPAIPAEPEAMPDEINYDVPRQRLLVGAGFIDNVPPAVWNYEVSGKRVLTQWFSYRKRDRERPTMGDRRPPSKLGEIQPDHWLAEYTT